MPKNKTINNLAPLFLLMLGVVAGATGCAGLHSLWNVQAGSSATLLSNRTFPPSSGPVFLTESGWPTNPPAETIAQLDAGTVTDEPTETVLLLMADKAREVGANAVVDLKIWRQGSGFSWKAPQASGRAIRISDTNAVSGLNGYWR